MATFDEILPATLEQYQRDIISGLERTIIWENRPVVKKFYAYFLGGPKHGEVLTYKRFSPVLSFPIVKSPTTLTEDEEVVYQAVDYWYTQFYDHETEPDSKWVEYVLQGEWLAD